MSAGVSLDSLARANYNSRIEVACSEMRAQGSNGVEIDADQGSASNRPHAARQCALPIQPAGQTASHAPAARDSRKLSARAGTGATSSDGAGTTISKTGASGLE